MTPIYRAGHILCAVIAKFGFGLKVFGQENLIQDGPAILASNHASYLDPPLVGVSCPNDIYYLARKSLMDWPILGWLIKQLNTIPIDRERGDLGAVKAVLRILKAGKQVIMFPEGTRSSDGKLQPGRAGIGLIIAKSLVPVVPVRIFGSFDALPRSGGLRFTRIKVVIGKPLYFRKEDVAGDERDAYQALSDRVMAAIAELQVPSARGSAPSGKQQKAA
ncbi:MAG: 1-acyl-sn-glycerol-3-phosphate acyltransferase [Verrucomicrobia bacterium]|nr:1-acyl-sn-glycerol-3-phosphate acyltransferase [Verrucomicrobiota bacterium]